AEIADLNGNPEQAIKDLEQAIKNGENGAAPIRRLVALLTQRGQTDRAQKLLDQMQQSALADKDLGRIAVAVAVSRGEMTQAEPILRRLARGEVRSARPEDVAWSRRSLAILLAAGTDYRRFTEALELVGLGLDGSGRLVPDTTRDQNTENRRTRARVLASQN